MKLQEFFGVWVVLSSVSAFAAETVTYEVPASSTTAATVFTLTGAGIVNGPAGVRELQFQLPADLVGNNSEVITLKEDTSNELTDFTTFTDGSVSAACDENISGMTCVLHYPDGYLSYVDATAVKTLLAAKFKDPAQFLTADTLANRFSVEPHGVIQILYSNP